MEYVDNNDTDQEEMFEKSVTFLDSQMIIVDDAVMKPCDSVMNSVYLDHE